MRALIQRVIRAKVTVLTENGAELRGGDRDSRLGSDLSHLDREVSGEIGSGLCVFVGVTHSDGETEAAKLADKIMNLRILNGEVSVLTAGGEVLIVSQFTLYGDTVKGRRPGWSAAAKPEHAEPLIDLVVGHLRAAGLTVATGRFRQYMQVELVNDGPTTLTVEV